MTQPHEAIEVQTLPIWQLFSDHFFEIPPNQREYSWEERDQVSRLWEDLVAVVEQDRKKLSQRPLGHFLGAIVVVGKEHSGPGTRHSVIDGQQRLTTITCLCRILLEYADRHSDPEVRRRLVNKLMPCVSADVAGHIHARMILNRENEFYRVSVLEKSSQSDREEYWIEEGVSSPAPRVRLVDCLRYFHKVIGEYLDSRAGGARDDEHGASEALNAAIADLVYALCDLNYVLYIRVRDYRMAYRFFETLNDRGLDLSQADLVKNSLLEHASEISDTEFKRALDSWTEMLDELDNQELLEARELLQYSFTSRFRNVKAESLFDVVSQTIALGAPAPAKYAAEVLEDARLWNRFLQGNLDYWTNEAMDARYFIVHIKPIWKKHVTPLLLRIIERFDSRANVAKLGKALHAVEAFLFREGTIRRVSVSTLEKVLGEAARIVGDESKGDGAFVKFLSSKAPDSEFREEFAVASAKGRLAFYIAWRLEKYALRNWSTDIQELSPAKQSRNTHLEHIMPKKPNASWRGIEEHEDFKLYIDRLGNHVVLASKVNQSIKNGKFADKLQNDQKKDYANQNLALPKQIIEKKRSWAPRNSWTFDSIKKRQRFLADEYALKVWKIDW